jgi:hypothetical protein
MVFQIYIYRGKSNVCKRLTNYTVDDDAQLES